MKTEKQILKETEKFTKLRKEFKAHNIDRVIIGVCAFVLNWVSNDDPAPLTTRIEFLMNDKKGK